MGIKLENKDLSQAAYSQQRPFLFWKTNKGRKKVFWENPEKGKGLKPFFNLSLAKEI
jgi:hypothetical protein